MKRLGLIMGILLMVGAGVVNAQEKFEQDVIKTGAGSSRSPLSATAR